MHQLFSLLLSLAEKPAFGELPCYGAMTTARRHLSADASMLCDGVLINVSWAVCWYLQRHVCMACEYAGGGSIKQIVPVYSMECQQVLVKHMTVHIVRDNAMPAI